MPSRNRMATVVWTVAALAIACGERPNAFERVDLVRARGLFAERVVRIVEAVDGSAEPELAGGLRWDVSGKHVLVPPTSLGPGGVLVIGANEHLAERGAAALARAGNAPVFLFIPETAEERASLYALALETEEIHRGRDL